MEKIATELNQYGLALHTTTPQLGLASLELSTGDRHTKVWELGRALSAELQIRLQTFMQGQTWEQLKFLAVAKGPGGFTSTRIGVVTARTMAQQLNLPLYGISTLGAIAWSLWTTEMNMTTMGMTETGQKVAVSLPARRGEIFGAIYHLTEQGIETVIEDQLFLPETFEKLALAEKAYLGRSPEKIGHTVKAILELGHLQYLQGKKSPWGKVVPFYGQHPVHKTEAR